MSGLLDQAGLTAGSGLSNGAGLYKWGSFNPFDPTDLDPYLLFDTGAGSMIGTLENPTLDLDPSNQETLDVITATRAGTTATYTDSSGIIQVASADTVRVDHVYGVPMILVEPSATNLVTYSEDFSQWADDKVVLTTGFSSPDGLTNAYNIKPSATSGVHLISSHGASSAIKTYSVYAKPNGYKYFRFNTGSSGNGFAEFDVESGAVVSTGGTYYSSSSIEPVGNGWFRCSMTLSAGAATNITIALEDNAQNVNFLADGTSGVYLWGAQLEAGSVSTSYIPTSGSTAQRAADDLVISGSAFSDFYNQSEGTVYCEFEYDFEPNYEYIYNIQQDGNNEIRNQFATSSNVRTRYVVAGVSEGQTSVSGAIQGSLNRNAYSYKTNNFRGSVNGSTEAEDLTGTASVSPIKLQIGGRGSGISNIKFKRLIYWPVSSERL